MVARANSYVREVVGTVVLGFLGAFIFGVLSALHYWLYFGPPSEDPEQHYRLSLVFAAATALCIVMATWRVARLRRVRKSG